MCDRSIDLRTSLHDVTTLEDAYYCQAEAILQIFEAGNLLETVMKSLPEPDVVENILDIYNCIGGTVFYVDSYEEEAAINARIAFPILIDRLQGHVVTFESLCHLASVYEFGLNRLPTGELIETWGDEQDVKIIAQIEAMFKFAPNARSVQKALTDPSDGYTHAEAIEIAVTMLAADEFDLRFSAIKANPTYFLRKYSYDLRRNEEQAKKILDWSRGCLTERDVDLHSPPTTRLQEAQYNVLALLCGIFSQHAGMGKDIVRYALACDNEHTRFSAVCVLSEWHVSHWPDGSHELLVKTRESMQTRMRKIYFSSAIEKWETQNSTHGNA